MWKYVIIAALAAQFGNGPSVPTFREVGKTAIVTTRKVELRAEPMLDGRLIARLPVGTRLTRLEWVGEWAKVRTRRGTTGYIPTIDYLDAGK